MTPARRSRFTIEYIDGDSATVKVSGRGRGWMRLYLSKVEDGRWVVTSGGE